MKTLLTILFAGLMFVATGAAEPAAPQNGPMIKNLMALTYRAPARAAVPQGLTKREVKKLAAIAELREDHLKLAGYL